MAVSPREQYSTTETRPIGQDVHPSRQSLRGLDWFIFCLADVQVGFGAFVAVYLTTQKWTQADIGLVLSLGALVALVGQIPGGAIVDSVSKIRLLAAGAASAIGASALAIGAFPVFPVVLAAIVVHSAASCILGPTIAALTLGLVGYEKVGQRLGRNASLASIGAGLTAGVMGVLGYLISVRSMFFITAALCVPILIALSCIRPEDIDIERRRGGKAKQQSINPGAAFREIARNRVLLTFAFCMILFHLGNAAMLPTLAGVLTMRSAETAVALIGACMVVPQLIVALFSPWVGRQAQKWRHQSLLLIGFAALPVRAMLFASVSNPYVLVLIQMLDGISAAILAVMVPLVIAEAMRGSGHFSLGQGTVGTAIGIGAALSTSIAGYISDHYGSVMTFLSLAVIASIGFIFVLTTTVRRPAVLAAP